jgi:hypothetical protein
MPHYGVMPNGAAFHALLRSYAEWFGIIQVRRCKSSLEAYLSMLKIYPVVLLAVFSIQPSSVAYQSSKPRTVLDYYLLLPDKYFEANKEQRVKWMLDPKRGAIVDVRNGYIYAPGDGAQMSIYVCLFKKADGSYLIGVKSSYWEDIEYTDLDFYIYEGGGFLEVTKSVLPIAENEELKYEMPRYGTTVKVRNKRGKKIYELVWGGERFRLKRA